MFQFLPKCKRSFVDWSFISLEIFFSVLQSLSVPFKTFKDQKNKGIMQKERIREDYSCNCSNSLLKTQSSFSQSLLFFAAYVSFKVRLWSSPRSRKEVVQAVGGILGIWVTVQHIQTVDLSFWLVFHFSLGLLCGTRKKEKETQACNACLGNGVISSPAIRLPSAWCQPAGRPWEFKTKKPWPKTRNGLNVRLVICPSAV